MTMHEQWEHKHRRRPVGERIASALEAIADSVQGADPEVPRSLNGYVSAVYGRSKSMPVNIPVPEGIDTEKQVLSIMPRKADGHVDTSASPSWVSSDPSQGEAVPGTEPFDFTDPQNGDEVVTCPGSFNCFATTPLTEGGPFNVTCSAAGYDSAIFGPITYKSGQPRSLNASVGTPVSDL